VAFAGFAPEALRFLADLRAHNERGWFHAHREEYESLLLEPARDLVEAMGEELAGFAPNVNADPRVGGSIFRIARDTRFSKDKRPYKDHLDMMFRVGPVKTSPGYWFRLTPNELILGAGMHMLDKPELERYRTSVDADASGAELAKIVAKEERAGYDVGGEHYKRVPAGFNADHPRAALLRHAGIYVGTDMDVPAEAKTAKFPAFCVAHYRKMAPLMDWLSANVA
jgi:uncharacterized protein (TIGR02453 family)